MAYIYQITNKINGKIYIGKTERTVSERWAEHCRDYLKESLEVRPLYRAMRKYGISNFVIDTIEETDIPEERERYWIETKRSFKEGYNATLGGDGRRYIDYDLVVSTYNNLQNITETAKILDIDISSVRRALNSRHISILSSQEVTQRKVGKIINQYDIMGNYIQSFPSAKAAAISLSKITSTSCGASSHISDVCRGKRKTAYGYIWKYNE